MCCSRYKKTNAKWLTPKEPLFTSVRCPPLWRASGAIMSRPTRVRRICCTQHFGPKGDSNSPAFASQQHQHNSWNIPLLLSLQAYSSKRAPARLISCVWVFANASTLWYQEVTARPAISMTAGRLFLAGISKGGTALHTG